VTAGYFAKRLLYSVVTIFAIVTLTFFLFRLLPGDPASIMIDPLTDPARREILLERYGLNKPLHIQYVQYFRLLLQGDLGLSYTSRQPVTSLLAGAFMNSFVLALAMFVLAYGGGSLLGAYMAWKRGSWLERLGVNIALIFRGAPPYFVGILLIMVLAIQRGWLPSSGMRSGGFGAVTIGTYFTADFLLHLVLPAVTGAIYAIGTPILIMRNSMLDVTQAEFLDLARAKGLTPRRVLFRHAFRNALLPLLAEGSQFFAYAIGGLVTIEVVFAWPGLGRTIVQALLFRDFAVAQGAFLYIGLLVVVTYFLSDVLAAWLDPRARRVERVKT
jgi:peptide/nickel transport system permease protein